jgi:hypothetical protein
MSLIGIDVQGIPEIQQNLGQLYPLAEDQISDDVLGVLLNIEQANAPYSYVSRATAYGDMGFGPGWFSDRQRRWFFAALSRGEINIPYRRTQALSQAWQIIGSGKTAMLVNDSPGVEYVKGDGTQARQIKLEGWTTLGQDIRSHWDRIMSTANAALNKTITKLGLR